MSDLIQTIQLQAVESEYIVLYDLEYAEGTFAYFTSDVNSDLSSIQFRDSSGTIRTYESIPVKAEDFETASDGAYNRPTLTVANALSTFKDALGGLDYEDLIGRRITKRTTLRKYLVGEPGDSNPPIEFPKMTYIIDRVANKTMSEVMFELAAPFDLAGIMLPKRIVIGGSCPWKYTGADTSRSSTEIEGGCNWRRSSVRKIPGPAGGRQAVTTTNKIYATKEDEYILSYSLLNSAATDSTTVSTYSSGSYYYTESDEELYSITGTVSTETDVKQFWQCVAFSGTTTVSPSLSSTLWKKVRTYNTYSASTTFKGYRNKEHNEIVEYTTTEGQTTVWQVKRHSVRGEIPSEGAFFTRADACGKKIESCRMRFGASSNSTSGQPGYDPITRNIPLPFGGFPGARQQR
jgi:lambda family phage minor tail protein L